MKTLTILFFTVLPFIHFGPDYEFTGWYIGFLGATVLCGIELWKRGFKLAALNFVYFVGYSLYVSCYTLNWFTPQAKMPVGYSGFYFLTSVLMILVGFINRDFFNNIPIALRYFCLTNSFYVIYGLIMGTGRLPLGSGYSGFIDYASVNGVLIACTVPFLNRPWMYLPAIVAIAASKSSAPWITLFSVVIALNIDKIKKTFFYLTALAIPAIFIERGKFLDDAGRLPAWKTFMTYWYNHFNVWVGTGPGTFRNIAKQIQLDTKYAVWANGTMDLWTHLHNEWLELLFETGAVGFCLFAAWYVKCLITHKSRCPKKFASLLAFGVASQIVFPLGYFWGAVICFYLMISAEFT